MGEKKGELIDIDHSLGIAANLSSDLLTPQPLTTTFTLHWPQARYFQWEKYSLSKYQLSLLKIPLYYFGCHLWRDWSLAESVLQMPPQSDMSCVIATTCLLFLYRRKTVKHLLNNPTLGLSAAESCGDFDFRVWEKGKMTFILVIMGVHPFCGYCTESFDVLG